MNVLFLYTELADYFIQCCIELSRQANVHIIRWPVNKEAPFEFRFPDTLKIYDKTAHQGAALSTLIDSIQPDIILCSGWIDKDYLREVKRYSGKVPTVITLDTQWRGSLKQHIASALSRFFIRDRFSHAWVPGNSQALYAKKLGFGEKNIRTGFYCCDLRRFNTIYTEQVHEKTRSFPKRFLYAGRYYDFKGVKELWQAFEELSNETGTDWELWCIGKGDIEPVQHPKIKHLGFVQPTNMATVTAQCGVFILPSRFEPWGVVVHEFAAAGFPLLLSKEVGAAEAFLETGKNGYTFSKENVKEIKESLKKMVSLSDEELMRMGKHSHDLAQRIHPEFWAQTIMDMYHDLR